MKEPFLTVLLLSLASTVAVALLSHARFVSSAAIGFFRRLSPKVDLVDDKKNNFMTGGQVILSSLKEPLRSGIPNIEAVSDDKEYTKLKSLTYDSTF